MFVQLSVLSLFGIAIKYMHTYTCICWLHECHCTKFHSMVLPKLYTQYCTYTCMYSVYNCTCRYKYRICTVHVSCAGLSLFLQNGEESSGESEVYHDTMDSLMVRHLPSSKPCVSVQQHTGFIWALCLTACTLTFIAPLSFRHYIVVAFMYCTQGLQKRHRTLMS